jgi:hypothetical protein
MKRHPSNIPFKYRTSTDIDSIDPDWRKDFEQEVADDNFVRGGRSLVLSGPGSEEAAEKWMVCLNMANMLVFVADPIMLYRLLNKQYIRGVTDEHYLAFEKAETILINDFFLPDPDYMHVASTLHWFMQDALRDGVTFVIASDDRDSQEGMYQYQPIAEMCEKHFEAVRNETTKKKT